jgi:glutathione S-transferase
MSEIEDELLALYFFEGCPFCSRVLTAATRLGVDLELRDIFSDPGLRRELLRATGRQTVPVLRIEDASGRVRWMPESADIVTYLEERFGSG